MNSPNSPAIEVKESLRYRIKDEFVHASLLALYFAAWFCAIAFFSFALLREEAIRISPFGLAIIKAGLCAKFMMIGKALFPLRVDTNRGVVKSLFWHSLAYLGVVITLSIIEAGIDGLFHGKLFLESASSFGHGDPIYIAALSLMYWLIVWPYLLVLGLNQSLGNTVVRTILFGKK